MVKRISLASNGKKFLSPPRDKNFFLSFFLSLLVYFVKKIGALED